MVISPFSQTLKPRVLEGILNPDDDRVRIVRIVRFAQCALPVAMYACIIFMCVKLVCAFGRCLEKGAGVYHLHFENI